MMKRILFATIALTLLSAYAHAQTSIDKGDWLVRAGGTYIDPSSSGLSVSATLIDPESMQPITVDGKVTADGDASVTFNVTYMVTQHIGIELLAALPFQHDLKLNDVTIGSTRQLPPTLSVQWHQPIGRIVPYVGLGLNWTEFYNERILGSSDILSLSDSQGIAAQLGFDFVLGERWLINADLRYIDIDTEAKIGGVEIGNVKVDPWTAGLNIGFRFN